MIPTTRFMRRPFYVEAVQVTFENMEDVAKWCHGTVVKNVQRPFVRVPVTRPTHKNQTEAYIGTWVLLSTDRSEDSYKVYNQEWLDKSFIEAPEDDEDEVVEDIPPVVEAVEEPQQSPCCENSHSPQNVLTLPKQSQSKRKGKSSLRFRATN